MMEIKKEQNMQIAYHEAGHIIFTYLSGYLVDSSELLDNGDGKTINNYEDDLLLVAAITTCISDPNLFNSLDSTMKRRGIAVANKVASILLAGSVAIAVYFHENLIKDVIEIDISGSDLTRIENVDHFLFEIKNGEHNSKYIQETISQVHDSMTLVEIWNSLSGLANALFEKKKLSRVEIENILNSTGFFGYLSTL